MGRGFGRGAKSVAIVTHAQVKSAGKKVPRGLRGSKRKRVAKRQRPIDQDDPNTMLNTRASAADRQSATAKALDAQIASIQIKENAHGRGLKGLRKDLIAQVKKLRRKHHEKRAKINAREREANAAAHTAAVRSRTNTRNKAHRRSD